MTHSSLYQFMGISRWSQNKCIWSSAKVQGSLPWSHPLHCYVTDQCRRRLFVPTGDQKNQSQFVELLSKNRHNGTHLTSPTLHFLNDDGARMNVCLLNYHCCCTIDYTLNTNCGSNVVHHVTQFLNRSSWWWEKASEIIQQSFTIDIRELSILYLKNSILLVCSQTVKILK